VRSLLFALSAVAGLSAALVSAAPVRTAELRLPRYPVHSNVVATVFWVGEPQGNGSSENNAISAWDDRWQQHYGGFDDPARRAFPFFPPFRAGENPFYLDLPYNDFDDDGDPRADRMRVVPWAKQLAASVAAADRADRPYSLLKNRWVKLWRRVGGRTLTCYGQIEDAGPYVYDDAAYVFGSRDPRPRSREANNAGLDVSPALRDCLRFPGLNDAETRVSWQFVERAAVPKGPWTIVVTTRQVYWP
jgi:hypothetical protein